MKIIDLNCDMGETIGNEEELMPFISSANIACGFHAGDANEIKKMVELCLNYDVAIGAHPSFPDKDNFGRTEMNLTTEKVHEIIWEQLHLINHIVAAAGGKLHHIKPHGALYNMAAKDARLANTLAVAVKDFDKELLYYGLAGSVMLEEASKVGLQVVHEVFADRTYQPGGYLTPRSQPGALIKNVHQAIEQVMQMIFDKQVTTLSGEKISIKADTICIHGDAEGAADFAKQIKENLFKAGILIQKK